jgi:integrase
VPFGHLPLRQVKLSQIEPALATKPDLCGKTVNNYVTPLREALQIAVDDGMLPRNGHRAEAREAPEGPAGPVQQQRSEVRLHPTPPARVADLGASWPSLAARRHGRCQAWLA